MGTSASQVYSQLLLTLVIAKLLGNVRSVQVSKIVSTHYYRKSRLRALNTGLALCTRHLIFTIAAGTTIILDTLPVSGSTYWA
jgi:hypothetical protein